MRKLIRLLQVLLIVALAVIIAFAFNVVHNQNYKGGYSSATICTEKARNFILKEFGDCKSPKQLLANLNKFACKRFTYVKKGVYLQYFDIDEFIFEDNFHGLCWDFACFTKITVLEVARYNGWQDVSALVCDAEYTGNGEKHSFNFVTIGNTVYHIDNTFDNTRYKNGEKPHGAREVLNKDLYLQVNNMELINYH